MEDGIISAIIDGIEVNVKNGTTILEAAKEVGIDIPTLCFLKDINEIGDCRICLVEVQGARGFVTACMQKVEQGMVIKTNTDQVNEARKNVLKLILSSHDKKCLSCIRHGNCELQKLALKFGITDIEFEGELPTRVFDEKSVAVVRDTSKCVLCRRCVSTCKNIQEIGAIDCVNRGYDSTISTFEHKSLDDVNCTFCGQCIQNCPTAGLHEKENIDEVYEKLKDEKYFVVVQTAPAVRVALGEEFGMEIGTNVEGKMITALKRLGFDKVFDTNTGADFTIMEETTEFINRVKNGKDLPIITSCCPAWVRFMEMEYPEMIKYLSTCKSPHEMFGAILKTYYANKIGINPEKIYVVSVMPCVAKKFERQRPEMKNNDLYNVDAVITTRELAKMIRQANIDFKIAVANGLGNARKIIEEIKSGKVSYDFIEIMACPGGCIMGGGQPIKTSKIRREVDVRKLRANAIYNIDEKKIMRKSHQNPIVKNIYNEYLKYPNSEISHELLHTKYSKREKYQ